MVALSPQFFGWPASPGEQGIIAIIITAVIVVAVARYWKA